MTIENILSEIHDQILNADLTELENNVRLLQEHTTELEASKKLSEIIYRNYTQYKSEYLSKVLETIIRTNPRLALVNHPENFLFEATIITGSVEMYECYLEESVLPFLSLVTPDEHEIHYMELLNTAQTLSEDLFNGYNKCIKGLNYNGSFGGNDVAANVVLVHQEDYEIMEDVLEKYNTLIGRRDIIKDLHTKAGLNL